METVLRLTVVVKGTADDARRELVNRIYPTLASWFADDPTTPPFPNGALLLYTLTESERA
jgi:hypothetical protein